MPAQEQLRPRLPWARRVLRWPMAPAVFLMLSAAGGIRLSIAMQEVQDPPSLNIGHPDLT